MWLLHTKTLELRHFMKTLELRDFMELEETEIRYAILLHVWEDVDHTQSFHDIRAIHARCVVSGEDPHSLVTEKVCRFCLIAEQAGYEWIWLDTCCIDKTSSTELSEAINSMWAWYQDAGICYAYLCDVGDDDDPQVSDSEFRRSKWHTRGWTLQELIAPREVIFLSKGWFAIGSKISLVAVVAEITKIDDTVLAQTYMFSLSRCSIARRMSWVSRRQTSRIEDRAYSLLGILGISMPIIYGEGRHSFTHLQIEILRHTQDHMLVPSSPYRSLSITRQDAKIG
ncbi:hypothetical protein L226DRAFT_545375 [Lentinus tigrinus ALCF2SS1-7]|uniref:uncharacterized protein n=1 Tax=Lentinus tigrinus ALCF2SS1-7 TaxID=1328758 RepID=UPI00116607C1|nr:hypothetical protein L226DRAFT_545375 [Lentinus tigrinus ALCF2SS1-7]